MEATGRGGGPSAGSGEGTEVVNCSYMCMLSFFSRVQLCVTPWTVAPRPLCPWNSPDKNTGVGCHARLQGIFPIQGSNPGLPRCRQILYSLSHQGSQEYWSGYPICSPGEYSWPRSQIRISCIAGRFFTSWATREAQLFTTLVYHSSRSGDLKSFL